VNGAASKAASGANPNPFYRVHSVAEPVVAPGAGTTGTATTFGASTIEFETSPGGVYNLRP
jgi:hypothetical protein